MDAAGAERDDIVILPTHKQLLLEMVDAKVGAMLEENRKKLLVELDRFVDDAIERKLQNGGGAHWKSEIVAELAAKMSTIQLDLVEQLGARVKNNEEELEWMQKPFPQNLIIRRDNHWNPYDKYTDMALVNNNLTAKLEGMANGTVRGSVRALRPLPNTNRGIFYFEVKILQKTTQLFYVGLSDKHWPLAPGTGTVVGNVGRKLAGGRPNTVAGSFLWYCSDGSVGATVAGEPTVCQRGLDQFVAGTVVGCGLHFSSKLLFFTFNGVCLDVAPLGLLQNGAAAVDELFPTICMECPSANPAPGPHFASVEANFGATAFAFKGRFLK